MGSFDRSSVDLEMANEQRCHVNAENFQTTGRDVPSVKVESETDLVSSQCRIKKGFLFKLFLMWAILGNERNYHHWRFW
jgi:hypothetical protein